MTVAHLGGEKKVHKYGYIDNEVEKKEKTELISIQKLIQFLFSCHEKQQVAAYTKINPSSWLGN